VTSSATDPSVEIVGKRRGFCLKIAEIAARAERHVCRKLIIDTGVAERSHRQQMPR